MVPAPDKNSIPGKKCSLFVFMPPDVFFDAISSTPSMTGNALESIRMVTLLAAAISLA